MVMDHWIAKRSVRSKHLLSCWRHVHRRLRFHLGRVLKLIYDVNGHRSMQQEMLPETRARLIIEKFDLNADQKLSRDEFIRGCLNDAEIRKLLTP